MSEGQSHGTGAAAGVARVRALLHAALDALAPLAVIDGARAPGLSPTAAANAAGREVALAAREASRGLEHVESWLQAVAPAPDVGESVASRQQAAPIASGESGPSREPAPVVPGADHLAGVLRTAIDDFEALGEAFEDEDPIVHFDAVQATSLATAVLEAAHQRLLRAGLVQPRRVSLLAP